jgi:uncharacterized protein (PEP-CTERM system associated)
MDFSIRDASAAGGEDTRFEHYGGTLGYGVTRNVQIFGTLGYDSNEYTAVAGSETSGRSWTVGANWSPNRRTDVEASFGESYFGRTYGFNLNYRNSHTVWTASYNDGVNDISQQLLTTQQLFLWDCNGVFFIAGILPPSGQTNCNLLQVAPIGSISTIGLVNGVYVSKTFRATAGWSKGRSTLGLSLHDTRREYQQIAGLPEDTSRGVTFNYGYRLQPLTTFNAGFWFTNTQSPANLASVIDRDDDFYSLDLGLRHQFGERLSSALVYRHQWRDSNDPIAEYTENNITASVNLSF